MFYVRGTVESNGDPMATGLFENRKLDPVMGRISDELIAKIDLPSPPWDEGNTLPVPFTQADLVKKLKEIHSSRGFAPVIRIESGIDRLKTQTAKIQFLQPWVWLHFEMVK